MGFRYRKSINLGGGFRVNISQSGIGYSWGTKGYRITKTASGKTRQTVSVPGTGLSYTTESGGKTKGKNAPMQKMTGSPNDPTPAINLHYTDVNYVTSTSADKLQSSVYDGLFKRIKLLKILNVVLIIAAILFIVSVPPVSILCILGLFFIHTFGRCTISYEFEPEKEAEWNKLSSAWRDVAKSRALRQITMTAKSTNKKVTAGIESGIDYTAITANSKLPWYVQTNVNPVVFHLKECSIAILPDRLFVFDKKRYGAIEYENVIFDLSAFGFVETGPVPKDSEVVKQVWAYANADGTPDKRYKDNRQFPVMKYGRIKMTSNSGLNIDIMCSNEAAADALNKIIKP